MIYSGNTPLEKVAEAMRRHGAVHIFFKLLANNDNSKNQIYFGGDFNVLRIIPHGELIGEISTEKKAIFKASLNLSWLPADLNGAPEKAPGAKLIFYPNYPEVRMSGFLRDCASAPSNLMKAPTQEQRISQENNNRCLVFGVCPDDRILAFTGAWGSDFSMDAIDRIHRNIANRIASVFFELQPPQNSVRDELISRLHEIYQKGPILSGRLSPSGDLITYVAKNAAGYTLESLFGIIPNSSSEPDFKGWELKSHKGGAVTLMTPEPDKGTYLDDLGVFLKAYGRCGDIRRDFTGKHQIDIQCIATSLILRMEGFDPVKCEIIDPNGGLILRDELNNIVAGWTFNKIVNHWSKKHNKTAYVNYTKTDFNNQIFYRYGPEILLCEGSELKAFLLSLYLGRIYYDPGINQKLIGDRWISKKRNQFRVAWNNVGSLYSNAETIRF